MYKIDNLHFVQSQRVLSHVFATSKTFEFLTLEWESK